MHEAALNFLRLLVINLLITLTYEKVGASLTASKIYVRDLLRGLTEFSMFPANQRTSGKRVVGKRRRILNQPRPSPVQISDLMLTLSPKIISSKLLSFMPLNSQTSTYG